MPTNDNRWRRELIEIKLTPFQIEYLMDVLTSPLIRRYELWHRPKTRDKVYNKLKELYEYHVVDGN